MIHISRINAKIKFELNKKAQEKMADCIIKIKNKKEAEYFLKDIFSSSELKDFSRRILAAEMLYKGFSYNQIHQLTGITPSTTNKIHFKTKGSKVLPDLFSRSKIKYRALKNIVKSSPKISDYWSNRLRKGK